MKLWVDDVRPAPEGYMWADNTDDAISIIRIALEYGINIEVIDLDHDAGDYAKYGGDYIKILDWMERKQISVPIRIHSMNPVGAENMRRIIQRNGWTEVK